MIDLYLRAATEAAMAAAIPFARTSDEFGERWIEADTDFALCVVGPVVVGPGMYDDNGQEILPPDVDTRFHVNLRCTEAIAALVPNAVIVTPENPSMVWA